MMEKERCITDMAIVGFQLQRIRHVNGVVKSVISDSRCK